MTTAVIGTRLREVLPEGCVDTTGITLTVNARDGGFYEYRPQAVVRVANEEDVRSLLAVAREMHVPVTFRAGGTSLAGQTVGEGIIADVSHAFTGIEVLDGGERVKAEPGPTAEMVNRVLLRFGRRIGPDPASARAARIGGIIANNSSGMITGVKLNAYHTMDSIRFVLADGSVWDTAAEGESQRFACGRPDLAQGLAALRDEARADADLVALINRKFSIKCVTGYGINALVDFDDPLAILAHLLVGSEGTLAFISHAVLNTVPLDPERSAGAVALRQSRDDGECHRASRSHGPERARVPRRRLPASGLRHRRPARSRQDPSERIGGVARGLPASHPGRRARRGRRCAPGTEGAPRSDLNERLQHDARKPCTPVARTRRPVRDRRWRSHARHDSAARGHGRAIGPVREVAHRSGGAVRQARLHRSGPRRPVRACECRQRPLRVDRGLHPTK